MRCRAVRACFAKTNAGQLQSVIRLQHRLQLVLIAVLALAASTASAQTVLSSGQLATCVNDGTVSYSSVQPLPTMENGMQLSMVVVSQTTTATLTCSQKLIVNLVIAAGSNLVTESLDFTVPCIGRYAPLHALGPTPAQ